MIDFEYRLISKALEGEHECFPTIRKQLKYLSAETRRRGTNQYFVEFKLDKHHEKYCFKTERYNGVEITDTFCLIEESEEQLNVTVSILKGVLKYFEISGEFDFSKNFTVKDVYWCKYWKEGAEHFRRSETRDLEYGFGYIPTYL